MRRFLVRGDEDKGASSSPRENRKRYPVIHRPEGWVILGLDTDTGESDPYDTKAKAEQDARGLRKFDRNFNRRDFFTVERLS